MQFRHETCIRVSIVNHIMSYKCSIKFDENTCFASTACSDSDLLKVRFKYISIFV